MRILSSVLIVTSVVGLVSSCRAVKSPKSTSEVASKDGGSPSIDKIENSDKQLYSLARYIENSKSSMPKLQPYVAPGAPYLTFGSGDKFQVKTNLEMDGKFKKALGTRNSLVGKFWVDAIALDKQVGGAGQGSLLDISVEANELELDLMGHIRFLGTDKIAGKLPSDFDQTLTRELSQDFIVYGNHLLGVKAGANVGGELGLFTDLARNPDSSFVLGFTPHAALLAGLRGSVEALLFSYVEVKGVVELLDTKLTTEGSVSPLPSIDMVLGDVGQASGTFNALDGKILIGAGLGYDIDGLPKDIDNGLWHKINSATHEIMKDMSEKFLPNVKWVHVVYDPEPIFLRELPVYTKPYYAFLKRPLTQAECDAQYRHVSEYVTGVSKKIEALAITIDEAYQKHAKDSDEVERRLRLLASVKTSHQMIASELQKECFSLD